METLDEITVEVRPMDGSGSLKAFADITLASILGEITLRGFRIIEQCDKPQWVAFPSNSYTKGGKIVNKPIVETSHALRRRIVEAILSAYERLKVTSDLPARPQRG